MPKARYGLPSRSAKDGVSVVRGRLPGASVPGKPSSSQNIWARVFRPKPSSGMTGDDWNQPPEGVAEIMLPQRSITSTCVVSPRLAEALMSEARASAARISEARISASVGSLVALPGADTGDRRCSVSITRATCASKPGTVPGSRSCDAVSPISARRSAL
ncbi:hypothetical protein D3C87_1456910 [compost metagenome]